MRLIALIPLVLLVGCGEDDAHKPLVAPSAPAPTVSSEKPLIPHTQTDDKSADNSGKNARDAIGNSVTPVDQGENASDLAITQSIRKALMAREDLSTNAKNMKVISKDGTVTLRGPVDNESERETAATIVRSVSGALRLDNQLEVIKH